MIFGDSSYIYVLLFSLSQVMVIYHIIYSEKTNFSELKRRILELWVNFKQNPLESLLLILVIYLIFWMLIVLVGLLFGLTLNTTNGPLFFFFTLAARMVLVKLFYSFVLFIFTGNREQWYSNLSLNPLILLALIPTTMSYYFLVLPIIMEFQFILSAKITIIFNSLGKLASTIEKT